MSKKNENLAIALRLIANALRQYEGGNRVNVADITVDDPDDVIEEIVDSCTKNNVSVSYVRVITKQNMLSYRVTLNFEDDHSAVIMIHKSYDFSAKK